MRRKSFYKRRKEIYETLWKREWESKHLNDIDGLAMELGIAIPKRYLVDFGPEEQAKILQLLLEAEKSRYLTKSWITSVLALSVSIVSVIAAWWAALR